VDARRQARRQQVLVLGRPGWSLRRIEAQTAETRLEPEEACAEDRDQTNRIGPSGRDAQLAVFAFRRRTLAFQLGRETRDTKRLRICYQVANDA
jgi:hypothetical protein